jgi:hypothetical protein
MSELFETKKERCRHSFPELVNATTVRYLCKKQDYKEICDGECDNCEHYNSRFIEYPITVTAIEQKPIDYSDILYKSYVGKSVAVRPCGAEKTYLGVFLGELPTSSNVSLDKNGKLTVSHMFNPAMFVPELNKIVFGCESWWKVLQNEEDFSSITDADIDNVWYVKALKTICEDNTKTPLD